MSTFFLIKKSRNKQRMKPAPGTRIKKFTETILEETSMLDLLDKEFKLGLVV
jgi:hypothetical protein